MDAVKSLEPRQPNFASYMLDIGGFISNYGRFVPEDLNKFPGPSYPVMKLVETDRNTPDKRWYSASVFLGEMDSRGNLYATPQTPGEVGARMNIWGHSPTKQGDEPALSNIDFSIYFNPDGYLIVLIDPSILPEASQLPGFVQEGKSLVFRGNALDLPVQSHDFLCRLLAKARTEMERTKPPQPQVTPNGKPAE